VRTSFSPERGVSLPGLPCGTISLFFLYFLREIFFFYGASFFPCPIVGSGCFFLLPRPSRALLRARFPFFSFPLDGEVGIFSSFCCGRTGKAAAGPISPCFFLFSRFSPPAHADLEHLLFPFEEENVLATFFSYFSVVSANGARIVSFFSFFFFFVLFA